MAEQKLIKPIYTGDNVTSLGEFTNTDTFSINNTPLITPAKGGTGISNSTNNTIKFNGDYNLELTLNDNTHLTLPLSGTIVTESKKYILPSNTYGLGLTCNTITSKTEATIDGYYRINDGIDDYIALRINDVWDESWFGHCWLWINSSLNAINMQQMIQRPRYYLGDNDEDELILSGDIKLIYADNIRKKTTIYQSSGYTFITGIHDVHLQTFNDIIPDNIEYSILVNNNSYYTINVNGNVIDTNSNQMWLFSRWGNGPDMNYTYPKPLRFTISKNEKLNIENLISNGNGDKFLSDRGTYTSINVSSGVSSWNDLTNKPDVLTYISTASTGNGDKLLTNDGTYKSNIIPNPSSGDFDKTLLANADGTYRLPIIHKPPPRTYGFGLPLTTISSDNIPAILDAVALIPIGAYQITSTGIYGYWDGTNFKRFKHRGTISNNTDLLMTGIYYTSTGITTLDFPDFTNAFGEVQPDTTFIIDGIGGYFSNISYGLQYVTFLIYSFTGQTFPYLDNEPQTTGYFRLTTYDNDGITILIDQIQLLLNGVWITDLPIGTGTNFDEIIPLITQEPYILSSNNEDELWIENTNGISNRIVINYPDRGLQKPIKVYLSTGNTTCYLKMDTGWYETGNMCRVQCRDITMTDDNYHCIRRYGDWYVLNKINSQHVHMLIDTNNALITDNWGNAPDTTKWYPVITRLTLNETELAKLQNDSPGILSWYTGTIIPDNTILDVWGQIPADGAIYLRSDGWIWTISNGTWTQSSMQLPGGSSIRTFAINTDNTYNTPYILGAENEDEIHIYAQNSIFFRLPTGTGLTKDVIIKSYTTVEIVIASSEDNVNTIDVDRTYLQDGDVTGYWPNQTNILLVRMPGLYMTITKTEANLSAIGLTNYPTFSINMWGNMPDYDFNGVSRPSRFTLTNTELSKLQNDVVVNARTINSYNLSNDINLTYIDVGAEPSGAVSSHTNTYNHANYDTAYTFSQNPYGKCAETLIVCKSGNCDAISINDALNLITNASESNPYIIKVNAGIYDEIPFTMKKHVSIIGNGSYYNTIIKTTDNNNHFITGNAYCELRGLSIEGPTGNNFAAIYYSDASSADYSYPFKVLDIAIRKGYYGIYAYNSPGYTYRTKIHCINVANWYTGSNPINTFIRAEGKVNITGMSCAIMSGRANTSSAVTIGVHAISDITASAEITLDLCSFYASNTSMKFEGISGFNVLARLTSCSITNGVTAILSEYADINAAGCVITSSVTNHLNIDGNSNVQYSGGTLLKNKITVATGGNLSASFTDQTTGEEGQVIYGELWLGSDKENSLQLKDYGQSTYFTGCVSGGGLVYVSGSGSGFTVQAGNGYINNGSTGVKRVSWIETNTGFLLNEAMQYISIDYDGNVNVTAYEPDYRTNILLAVADTDGSNSIFIADHRIPIDNFIPKHAKYLEEVVGCISTTGGYVSKSVSGDYKLDVTSGSYYRIHNRMSFNGGTPVNLHLMYKQSNGVYTHEIDTHTANGFTIPQNEVDYHNYNNAGYLSEVPSGSYKRDLLFIHPAAGIEYYHLIYGETTFTTIEAARVGVNPIPPASHLKYSMRAAAIISNPISGIVEIIDQRPKLGQMASATTSITSHNDLSGILGNGNNHISDSDLAKLNSVAFNADVNVNADWNSTSGVTEILNKPTLGTSSIKDIAVTGNATTNQVVMGNDTRLTDNRTPVAHTQAESTITFTNITTGNATVSNHGYLPILDGVTTNFLNGNGLWSTPIPPYETNLPLSVNARGASVGVSNTVSRGDHVHALSYFTDFLNSGTTTPSTLQYPWLGAGIGAGATNAQIAGVANHPGINQFRTTAINIGFQYSTYLSAFLLTGNEESEFIFRITNTTASTTRMGFFNTVTNTTPTYGVWIDVVNNTLKGSCNNNGGVTSTPTTSVTLNTWYRAYFVVNVSSVTFYLYDSTGSQLWTDIVSNVIPTTACGHGIASFAHTAPGGSINLIDIDFMRVSLKSLSR